MQQEQPGVYKEVLQDKLPKEQLSKWTRLELKQIDKLLEESTRY